MKKCLFVILILSLSAYGDDLDLGSDFTPGDPVTASEFNSTLFILAKVIKISVCGMSLYSIKKILQFQLNL